MWTPQCDSAVFHIVLLIDYSYVPNCWGVKLNGGLETVEDFNKQGVRISREVEEML